MKKKKKPHIHGKGWCVYFNKPYFNSHVYRPNKVAVHYQRKAKIDDPDLRSLAVYGTLDSLSKRGGFVCCLGKRIRKEHPINKGYFMDVYVLSKYGAGLLKRKRNGQLPQSPNDTNLG